MKDVSLTDIEELLREHLIDKGWTPPDYEKKKKIELQGINHAFDGFGEVYSGGNNHISANITKSGRSRRYEKQAEIAAKGMLRRNRLSALAETVGDGEVKYDKEQSMYGVRKNDDGWIAVVFTTFHPEVVYMNESTAQAVVDCLNNGEFEL